MFAIKIAIYWLARLVICEIDTSRWICGVIAKGFVPCLATFAVMDFLVIPLVRTKVRQLRETRKSQLG